MKTLFKETWELKAETIDDVSERIESTCQNAGCDSKRMVRMRLAVENVLLQWWEGSAKTAKVKFTITKKSGNIIFELKMAGPKVNPFSTNKDEVGGDTLKSWLSSIIDDVTYQYFDDLNILIASIPCKRVSGIWWMLGAMAGGVIAGILSRYLDPAGQEMVLAFVAPISKTLVGILTGIMGPMVFLSVMMGFARLGHPQTLNATGQKIIRNILGGMGINIILAMGVMFFLIPLSDNVLSVGSITERLFALVIRIIPTNVFEPFVKNDLMQIVILAVGFGVGLVYASERIHPIIAALQLIEEFFVKIVAFFCRFLPLLIFFVLFNVVLTTDSGLIPELGSFLGCYVLLFVVLMCSHCAIAYFRLGIRPSKLWEKGKKPLLIALASAASLAAFSDLLQTCQRRFGVSDDLAILSIPLGQTLYQMGSFVGFLSFALMGSYYEGLQLGFGDFAFIAIVSMILTLSVAPASGGDMAVYALLFAFLGISTTTLGIAFVATVFVDNIATLLNVFGNMILCLETAQDTGKLDKKIFYS